MASAQAAGLAAAWPALPEGTKAMASNVAGSVVRAHIEAACAQRDLAVTFIRSASHAAGVSNGYRDPAQLGTDRWAGLVAAHHAGGGHKLVVNAGTALTIDALACDGRFLGGLIVPGPALMRRSLDRGTAGLRLTEGTLREFPESTPDAITSGAIQAAVGAVERLAGLMAARGCPPGRIILSGGAAAEIAKSLPITTIHHENLVLDGLLLIARNS